MKSQSSTKSLSTAGFGALLGLSSLASAATLTWDGGGADNNWLSPDNWAGNSAPSATDTLVFDGASRLAPTNDFTAGTTFGGFTFATSAGSFALAGNSLTLGGNIGNNALNAQSIANALVLGAAPTVNVSQKNGALTLGGAISGSFGLTKSGSGLAVLNVANTFTGTINITGGTLSYGGGGDRLGNVNNGIVIDGGSLRTTTGATLVSTRGITVGNAGGGAGTLDLQNNVTYAGVIAGASATSGFTKTGSSTLTLTGTNTYTGATTLNQGFLTLDLNAAAGGVTSIINGGSALVMGGYGTSLNTVSQGINGPTVYFQGRSNTASAQTFNGLTLNQGNATLVVRTIGTQAATMNLGAITRNAGGLVNFSRIEANAADVDPVFTTSSTNTNGILGGWATTSGVAVSGSGQAATDWATVSGGNIVAYTGYTVPTGATPTLANDATSNVRLDSTSTGNVSLTYASNVSDLNTIQMTDTSARVLAIAAGNTLRLGSFGGIWKTQGNGNALTIGATANTGTLTAGGAANTAGEIVFNANATNVSTNGIIVNSVLANNGSGVLTVTKTGQGSMDLAGTNTYTGNTYINQGRIGAGNARSFGGDGTTAGSGTVYIQPGGQAFLSGAVTYANNFVIAGNGTSENGSFGAVRLGNAVTTVGTSTSTITLAGDSRMGRNNDTNIATLAGKITGDFNLELAANGGGAEVNRNVFLLTNTGNDWGGHLGINAQSLGAGQTASNINSNTVAVRLGASGVIANGAGKGNVVIGGGTNAANLGTLDLNGFNETINGLVSVGTAAQTRVTNNAAGTGTATLTLGDGDATANFGGIIRNGATASTAITKIGGGTQTFTGVNTYTGTTTITGGTLALSGGGSIANSANLVVNSTLDVSGITGATFTVGSSQTLSGIGTIVATGKTVSIEGTHAVGSSPGQQDIVGNLNYASSSIFAWDLNAAASDPGAGASNSGVYDQLGISGDLTGSGAVFQILLGTNSFTDAFWDTNKTWNNIFTAANAFDLGAIFTNFGGAGVDSGGLIAGQGSFTFSGGSLNWSAVPEPSSAAAGLLLGIGLLFRRRR